MMLAALSAAVLTRVWNSDHTSYELKLIDNPLEEEELTYVTTNDVETYKPTWKVNDLYRVDANGKLDKVTTTNYNVVILQASATYQRISQGTPDGCGDGSRFNGLTVYNVSSSKDAVKYELPYHWDKCPPPGYVTPTNIPLAQAIADLLEQGYRIQSTEPWVMMVKP